MTVVIGAVLLVWFTGLKSFLFSFGITFKGMYVWFPILNVFMFPSYLGLIALEVSTWIGATTTGTNVFPSILIGLASLG